VGEHPRIDVTLDAVVFAEIDGLTHALVVRRGNPPFEGQWALPGGYLEVDEGLAVGAARELEEETGIAVDAGDLHQLGAYGAPDRDPRNRTVSVAHVVRLDHAEDPRGGSDAAEAQWRPVTELLDSDLAFDHATILSDALARAGSLE